MKSFFMRAVVIWAALGATAVFAGETKTQKIAFKQKNEKIVLHENVVPADDLVMRLVVDSFLAVANNDEYLWFSILADAEDLKKTSFDLPSRKHALQELQNIRRQYLKYISDARVTGLMVPVFVPPKQEVVMSCYAFEIIIADNQTGVEKALAWEVTSMVRGQKNGSERWAFVIPFKKGYSAEHK